MANVFTLTQNQNLDWQGATGATVTVKVVPKDTTLQLSIDHGFYPGTTPLNAVGDTATFKVAAGTNDLNLFIKPKTVPAIIWSVVEVGSDQTTQVLDSVNVNGPEQDAYSSDITIVGA